jgi:hypothetical protein
MNTELIQGFLNRFLRPRPHAATLIDSRQPALERF